MTDYLRAQLRAALADAADAADASVPADFAIELETPADPAHGDLATNTALRLARVFRTNPRAIADDLAARLRERVDPARIDAVDVAGPGFINVRFAADYLTNGLAAILEAGDAYGRTDAHAGERALVEYVSANPTGPLTVGHGRNAVLGDTLANLLAWTGYEVDREYYFNDAGRQMRVLAQSVRARYESIAPARDDTPIDQTLGTGARRRPCPGDASPTTATSGAYVIDIAQAVVRRTRRRPC